MSPAIVVVGSYVQDLVWRCADFPFAGETTLGLFSTGPGGKGSNQAIAAARAGGRVAFVGAVGRDVFAAAARDFYRREKISARFCEKPSLPTGTAGILVNAAGENQITVALGANGALAPRDVDAALIRKARIVVTQHETNLSTTAHVLRLARRAGVTTVHNPAPMRPDFDPRLLASVDILIPNEREFIALLDRVAGRELTETALAEMSDRALHGTCRSLRVPTVIVTLGARGCLVSREEGFTRISGHRGLKVVDTTGAGDAFVGGFAAGFIRFDGDVVRAARLANAIAALSVTRAGTAPAMPRTGEIARFVRSRRVPA